MPRNMARDKEKMKADEEQSTESIESTESTAKSELHVMNEEIFNIIEDVRATNMVASLYLENIAKKMEELEEKGIKNEKYDCHFKQYFYHQTTQNMLIRAKASSTDCKNFLGEFSDRMEYLSQGNVSIEEIRSHLEFDKKAHEFYKRTP